VTPKPRPVVGRFIPEAFAARLHAYLMSKPGDETFDLIVELRSSKPVYRAPK
jgi:hypothetical protein